MVHRRYRVNQPVLESVENCEVDQPAYIRTPNPNAKNYALEMSNGSTILDENQQSMMERGKNKFRDEVSKRMGDLLLRGNTMLDAYCQTCNGILMEDRQKVRSCIQCELYKELSLEPVSSVIAEIPLDYDADGFVPGNSKLVSKTSSSTNNRTAPCDIDNRMSIYQNGIVTTFEDSVKKNAKCSEVARKPEVKNLPNSHTALSKKTTNKENLPVSGMHKAVRAVDRKMSWCADRLNETEDLEEISKLMDVIGNGVRLLNEFTLSAL